jgi:DNA polymerase I-like protein with 3'-5' exonuclease and polymerase domains
MSESFLRKKSRCDSCPLEKDILLGKFKRASKRKEIQIKSDLEDYSNVDYLFLTDCVEQDKDLDKLYNLIRNKGIKNFAITSAIGCRTVSYEVSTPLYVTYNYCNSFNIKKFNPKVVFTFGKAMLYFTRGSVFNSWRDFREFIFNETYFYPHIKEEWKGRIYPCSFIHDLFQFDTFEHLHFSKNLEFAQKHIDNYLEEKFVMPEYTIHKVEDINTFLEEHRNEKKIALDTETNSLNVFVDDFKMGSVQISFDGKIAYYIPFNIIEPCKKEFSDWLNDKFIIGANCLEGRSKILLDDGTEEYISNIVNKKLDKKVLCYDNNGEIVSRKILNYFNNGKNNNHWYDIRWMGKYNGKNYSGLYCTGEHKIFTQRGEVSAENLCTDDNVRVIGGFNGDFKSFLLGSYLGDANFSINISGESLRCNIEFNHAVDQKEWLLWKRNYILDNGFNVSDIKLRASYKENHQDQYRFRMNATLSLRDLSKIISIDYCLDNLDLKSLLVWYLDDGNFRWNKNSPCVRISIKRFSKNQAIKAIEKINNILNGDYCTLSTPSKSFGIQYESGCIYFNTHGSKIFLNLIKGIQPALQYKNYNIMEYDYNLWDKTRTFHYVPIISITKILPGEQSTSVTKYDIEVEEFHNYIANGIQVHNCKYDMKVLNRIGVKWNNVGEDINLIFHLLNTERDSNSIKVLSWLINFGGYEDELDEFKKKNKIKNYLDIPENIMINYAGLDAIITYRLEQFLHKYLVPRQQDTYNLYREIVIPVIPVFQEIEENGLLVDREYIKNYHNELMVKKDLVEKEIYRIAGRVFNINSNDELGSILKEAGLPNYGTTKKGLYQTNEEILLKWKKDGYEIVEKILEYRKIAKLDSTYIGNKEEESEFSFFDNSKKEKESIGIYQHIMSDNKVHGNIMPAMTDSWRSLSLNPNMQNFPKQGDEGKAFRKVFVSPEDYYFCEADYSGFQLRLMGIYSKDESMIDAFISKGGDLHSVTGCEIFSQGTDLDYFMEHKKEDPYKTARFNGKTTNLAFAFCQSPFSFQNKIREEWTPEQIDNYIKNNKLDIITDKKSGFQNKYLTIATDINNRFFIKYPNIKSYASDMQNFAKENGYVDCPIFPGLRRHIPELLKQGSNLNKEKLSHYSTLNNIAVNTGAQGGEAVIIYKALVKISNKIKELNLKSMLVGCVHDSIVLYLHKQEIEKMYYILKECMEVFDYTIPILCEMDVSIDKDHPWGFGIELDENNLNEVILNYGE